MIRLRAIRSNAEKVTADYEIREVATWQVSTLKFLGLT
jgi:hypothetical protein